MGQHFFDPLGYDVGSFFEQPGGFIQQIVGLLDIRQGRPAGQGFYSPYTGSHARFLDDFEKTDVPGGPCMGPAAELFAEIF